MKNRKKVQERPTVRTSTLESTDTIQIDHWLGSSSRLTF